MSLSEILNAILAKPNRQMAWGRIPPNHVIGERQPPPFEIDKDYFIVRLNSMFLSQSRVLWLKLSPLAHATVSAAGRQGPRSASAVVGPAQFGNLAAAGGDRSIVLHQVLSGPSVWRGGDLAIDAGLFAVPRDEAATALLTTLGQLASLGVPGVKQAAEIANVVKSGVEGLIGLQGTKPVLGVRSVLRDQRESAETEAVPCVLAAVAAPAAEVDFSQLWVKEGRLHVGSAMTMQPMEKHDHLLIGVERGPPREDWRGLPSLAPHEATFDAIVRGKKDGVPVEERLNEAFVNFDTDLTNEEELTEPDKDRIRGQVIEGLQRRIVRKGPFGVETRSVAGHERKIHMDGFDYLDVGAIDGISAIPVARGVLPFDR